MPQFIALLTVLLLTACVAPAAVEKPAPLPGAVYAAQGVGLADIEQALASADREGKRLLVVLGADWCHDSRALAERLQTEPLATLVAERYALRMVDVDFLERGRDVAQRFGVSQIYATPTVLVVEPRGESLVNAQDRHQWGAASTIGMSEALDYFRRMAEISAPADPASGLPAEFSDPIFRYERNAAEHVAEGYARVGPLLRAYKAGQKPAGFEPQWEEVAAFRKAVPGQLRDLWEQARELSEKGAPAGALHLPDIRPWSWQGAD